MAYFDCHIKDKMTDVNMDVTSRDDIFPGLSVKIKTEDGIIVEGIVKKILTLIAIDYQGITIQLETDEIGKVIEIIQTASEIEYNNLASEFNKDITMEEMVNARLEEISEESRREKMTTEDKLNEVIKAGIPIVGRGIKDWSNWRLETERRTRFCHL